MFWDLKTVDILGHEVDGVSIVNKFETVTEVVQHSKDRVSELSSMVTLSDLPGVASSIPRRPTSSLTVMVRGFPFGVGLRSSMSAWDQRHGHHWRKTSECVHHYFLQKEPTLGSQTDVGSGVPTEAKLEAPSNAKGSDLGCVYLILNALFANVEIKSNFDYRWRST